MADDHLRVWVGNLPEKINDELLYELFLQAGPVKDVTLPKQPDGRPRPFGFITFKHECSVLYSKELFKGTTLFGKQIQVEPKIKDRFKDMPQQSSDGLISLNSLRGFNEVTPMRGQRDSPRPNRIPNSNINYIDMNLLPQDKGKSVKNNLLPNIPDFNLLLQMGQQLIPNSNGPNMLDLGFGSPTGYPSQALDPVMGKHDDNYFSKNDLSHYHDNERNRSYDHDHNSLLESNRDRNRDNRYNRGRNRNNDYNSERNHDNESFRNQEHDRDHDFIRNRPERNRPYRDNWRDDRRHTSSRNHSSNSRHR